MCLGGGVGNKCHALDTPQLARFSSVSGIPLISWPADIRAFGTSSLNSSRHQGRDVFFKNQFKTVRWTAHIWQSDFQASVTSHKKDRLEITPAQLQTYLACGLDLQTPCLITWWDYYHQLKKKKIPNVKSIHWLMHKVHLSIQQMPLLRLFSLQNKPLLAKDLHILWVQKTYLKK